MATYVAFHAHPDDEAIATGGTMRLASEAGHRVVLVLATRGECGEVAEGFLDDGETLGQRRETEARSAAELLGVHRVEFLGYHDSGMDGEASNDAPGCFWQADLDEAAERLASILRDEDADIISLYDSHGGYGHPDHIQVHRVGHLAAKSAGTARVYESTMNREYIAEMIAMTEAAGAEIADAPDATEVEEFGSPASIITTTVDVSSALEVKKAAMAAHASQITGESFFMTLPDEIFAKAFGLEWYIRTDSDVDGSEDSIFGTASTHG